MTTSATWQKLSALVATVLLTACTTPNFNISKPPTVTGPFPGLKPDPRLFYEEFNNPLFGGGPNGGQNNCFVSAAIEQSDDLRRNGTLARFSPTGEVAGLMPPDLVRQFNDVLSKAVVLTDGIIECNPLAPRMNSYRQPNWPRINFPTASVEPFKFSDGVMACNGGVVRVRQRDIPNGAQQYFIMGPKKLNELGQDFTIGAEWAIATIPVYRNGQPQFGYMRCDSQTYRFTNRPQ